MSLSGTYNPFYPPNPSPVPPGVQTVSGSVSVSSAVPVQVTPLDPTTSLDTRLMQALLSEQRLALYQQLQLTAQVNGQFIPVPEALPFLAT